MLKELYHGFYATHLYLPFSALSKRWRDHWRRRLGKADPFMQDTHLPSISWCRCVAPKPIRLLEHRSENGNVRISELGILAQMAANCPEGSTLFEIGTFDGRTTLNLAINAPRTCRIFTLDLHPDTEPRYALASGERHFVDKPTPGMRYRKHRESRHESAGRITQLLGDSATFDFSSFRRRCSLVFVDGSHAYDYVLSDTDRALELVDAGGVIVWHDYGVWEGVTRALEEIEAQRRLGLRHLKGTSLVFWRNDEKGGNPR